MARLPDAEQLGALLSAVSNRPIASYDVSGTARGASAMAEGVSNFGKGFGKAADTLSERNRLDGAKADAATLVVQKDLRTTLASESDPDAVAKTYPEAFRNAYAGAADLIADPQTREVWNLTWSADRDGEIAASLNHAETLRRAQELDGVKGQLATLQQSALDSGDEATRANFINAGHRLIAGLEGTGLVDEAAGKAMRTDWTQGYVQERLMRLSPQERLKALESGEGIAEFVPEEKRPELIRTAKADALDLERKAQSDAGLARYTTDKDIADDLLRVAATGRGRDDLTPQRIDDTLGSEARRVWQAQRDDARTIWSQTHDLSMLTDADISARVEASAPSVEPDDDGRVFSSSSTRQQAIHDQVRAKADAIRQLRLTDPAASVADDPNVKAAQAAFDPQRPETVQALIDARLAAQQQAGIEKPAIVTLVEAKSLLKPLFDAAKADTETQGGKPELLERAQKDFLDHIDQTYGPYADAVIGELSGQMVLAGADDTSSARVRNENSTIKNLIVPVQYRIGTIGLPPPPITPLTLEQQREAWEFFKSIPGRAQRNAGLAWLMMQFATDALRKWSHHAENSDEPNGVKNPPYPGANTDDPSELVDRSIRPASEPPPDDKQPNNPVGNAATITAGLAVSEIEAQKKNDHQELDAFLDDRSEQRRFIVDLLKEDFPRAMTRIQNEIQKQNLNVSPYTMAGFWYYTGGTAYERLNTQYAAGSATQDDRKLVAIIEKGIAELPINNQTVYRSPVKTAEEANKIYDEAIVGDELTMPSHLQSYTLDAWRAAKQARKADILFKITRPTKGALIEGFSQFPPVREVLLPSGLRYKVISKDGHIKAQGKMFRVIELEIVGD